LISSRGLQQPNDFESPEHKKGRKFYAALATYAGIALLAEFTLTGKFRFVVWIFMAYLAVRTYLHTLRKP